MLLLVIKPVAAGYAQTSEAPSAPSVSVISAPNTSQTAQTTENDPAQPTTASLPSTSQTQQAADSSPPALAPRPANTTKAKRKRHHLSGVDIGIFVATGVLLIIVLGALRGK